MDSSKKKLKTNIYIDGYNFYYGCLKNTSYKWLDLEKLFFVEILPSIRFLIEDKEVNFIKNNKPCIKFFTAEISAKISVSDESLASQRSYHQALKKNDNIEIIYGAYSISKDRPFVATPDGPDRPNEDRERVHVLKIEEKMTDVNISLHAYHDAITDADLDVVVLVTNDTDLVPAVEFIKKYTDKKIIIITPTRVKKDRRTNSNLAENADIVRQRIDDLELKRSQLERVISGKRRAITKPISWYGNYDILVKILDVLRRINGGNNKNSFQWLNSTKIEELEYQQPIVLIEEREQALKIFDMVSDYLLSLEDQNSLRP